MNLQVDESEWDWSRGKAKRSVWQPTKRTADIFKGSSYWETATVQGVKVFRLSILPEGAGVIPESFTVVGEPEWTLSDKPHLPLALDWQQSLEARFDFYFDLKKGLKCLGLGERFSGLNVRGEQHTLISTDNPNHEETMDPMYKPIPFLLVGQGDKYVGIYFDSPAPSRFDLDSELTEEGHIELFTRRGFRLYVFDSDTLPVIVTSFTALVGRASLPPLWSLGHQQCRWSYPDEATVRDIAREFRSRKIPCDTIVLDIDYMDGYRCFTHSKEAFPNLKNLIADLDKDNFQVITIVDPGIKQDPDYKQFAEGRDKQLFCKTADGEIFFAKVWPGVSAFPDFLKEATRRWWAKQHKFFTDMGVAGVWNDMNEPAFFGVSRIWSKKYEQLPAPADQMCMQEGEQGQVPHFEVRNLYGFLMSRATCEGLRDLRPNERPFVLTRSATAGIQRYAAVWLGDNKSWYQHLAQSLPMLMNLGLSGVPFAGVDIGGFWDNALPELLIRWYEVGIFYPFFRNHCGLSDRAQEPFAYAPAVEEYARKLIGMRYRLLPYIRNLFWEHARTGAPLMRPLLWHYPNDAFAADIDDQFMFGPDILVAPVTQRAHESRSIYFPEGNWYHIETREKFEGKRSHCVSIPLGTVPAFVREGAILPLAEPMQHTREYSAKTITFEVYGATASGRHFEDDGISFGFEQGQYNEYSLSFAGGKMTATAVHKGFDCPQKYRCLPAAATTAVELKLP